MGKLATAIRDRVFRPLGLGLRAGSVNPGKSNRCTSRNPCDNHGIMETLSLDLSYLERDPRTKQPSACVYLKASGVRDFAGIKAEKLVTVPCLSFIELDAEIRRLHAELDEIRARAKKQFYKADAAAVGVS
jgi:hypothetical protein